ncbi:MAG: recombinase family protein [Pseudomonadota bacterium]
MEPKEAVVYYRVSSEKQRETQSITLQKIKLTTFAKDKGYVIIKEFQDDGISGESISKRPGFQDCLEYISDGKIDYLLVFMVDRIGRFAARKDRNQVVELLEESKTTVDSPYDGQFRYDNESDMNALEVALNESRRDNVKRGIRVHEGHMAKRLAGGFSGGRTPYGIRYNKKTGFTIDPAEKGTLEEIFKQITAGMGMTLLRDHLNANLERFPKRFRKFKGRPITLWSDIHIWFIAHNDFYFTGIIQPTKESLEKGIPMLDTGIKLFPQSVIEHARREMATRRFRHIDNQMEGRKRTHAQQGKIFFTDVLLHGLVRCSHCGCKLGLHQIRNPSGKIHRYYICRNHTRRICPLKTINTRNLDKSVWNTFVKTIEDPDSMKALIMQGEFLVDKDRASQETALTKAGSDLSKLHDTIGRIKDLYQWGDINKDDYHERTERMQRLVKQKQEEVYRLEASILRPKEIENAVGEATEYVTNQNFRKFVHRFVPEKLHTT